MNQVGSDSGIPRTMKAIIRDFFGLICLVAILTCAGCGKPVIPAPDNSNGGSLWQLDSEEKPPKLVSASVDEQPVVPAPALPPKPISTPGFRNPSPAPSRPTATFAKRPPMLAVTLRSGRVEGVPIGLFADKTLLMRTNGAIVFLDKEQIVGQKVTNRPFTPQDLHVLMPDLQTEFGNNYRIRNALPYLVIAKPSRIATWCERFDRMNQSIGLFCSNYGIPVRSMDFPLIAIVFGSRAEFEQYASSESSELPRNCVGYYSQKSNRIVLYEGEGENETQATLETICHEATHQFAFNSGLHQRLAETPLWVMEGFAVQFEAPAYCNYSARDRASLWPPSQRSAWETLKKDRKHLQSLCQELIVSDKPFKTETLNAYTAAWAMSSYLSQRRGQQYAVYMKKIASMKPFEDYSAGERLRDFTTAFGADLGVLLRETMQHIDRIR
jgi:hypothetical protein